MGSKYRVRLIDGSTIHDADCRCGQCYDEGRATLLRMLGEPNPEGYSNGGAYNGCCILGMVIRTTCSPCGNYTRRGVFFVNGRQGGSCPENVTRAVALVVREPIEDTNRGPRAVKFQDRDTLARELSVRLYGRPDAVRVFWNG